MTVDEIRKRVDVIRMGRLDYEVAHAQEDELRRDFIRFVEETGSLELAALAREILRTESIDFPRYCA